MGEVLVTKPATPLSWNYNDDHIVAVAISRQIATFWGHVDLEPELGIGQRFGEQDETEFWGAFFFRYHGFPWDKTVLTTVAISTGLNYATGVSEVELGRAHSGEGGQSMHFFPQRSPSRCRRRRTMSFFSAFTIAREYSASSARPWGGAQYGTIGLRVRF